MSASLLLAWHRFSTVVGFTHIHVPEDTQAYPQCVCANLYVP